MSWKPIIVAVDDSREAAAAAALGWHLARAAGVACHLIHAVRDPGTAFAAVVRQGGRGSLDTALAELVGPRLCAALGERVPRAALANLAIRIGRAAPVLRAEARRVDGGLVVLGGRHHFALRRWLGGSTARDAIRTVSVPVLVTRGAPPGFGRVLVAVDLSYAAEPAIREAERFAELAGGELRAIHVLEPLALIPEVAQFVDQPRFNADSVAALERDVWPLLHLPRAERTIRAGDAAVALAAEAAEWRADLLVVGSHGKGWVERALLGTTTERLLNELPASLLVVPVRKPGALERAVVEARGRRLGAAPLRLTSG